MSLLHLHTYCIYTHRSGIPRHHTKQQKLKVGAPGSHPCICTLKKKNAHRYITPRHQHRNNSLGCRSTTLSLSINESHLFFPFHLLFPIESSGIISCLPLPVAISRDKTILQTTAPSAAYKNSNNYKLPSIGLKPIFLTFRKILVLLYMGPYTIKAN